MKRAIIYYSLTNNTEKMAEDIAKKIDADLFQIELVKPMPDSFNKQILLGGMQSSMGMKPKIKDISINIDQYDEIILGTPIWAGKAAAPINTLLKKYNVADKVKAVFTFSGGGDNDKCIIALEKKLKNIKVNVAFADSKSENANKNNEKLEAFLKNIAI